MPRLRRLVSKMKLALAGLVGGFAFACSGPTNPGEMPPLAPRPEPVQPAPGGPPKPVPGAPDPTAKPADAGVVPLTHVELKPQSTTDAGVDALVLPEEIPDAMPPDANKQPASTSFNCC